MKKITQLQHTARFTVKGLSISIAAAVLATLVSHNGAFAESEVKTGEVVVSGTQYQILDKDLATISFDEGSAVLSDSSMKALSDFAKATNGESKVDHYIVASWGDQDFPAKGELSRSQRKLADLRANNIKKVLGSATSEKIKTFEMTKQPNWIQRAFSTETAELKSKGASNTSSERVLKEIGQRLHDKGGPRTAVIVARFSNEVSTN
jgi:hypothetical protein